MAVVISAATHAVGRLPAPVAVAVGFAALILVVMPGFWEMVRLVDTMAHEGAHAVVGSCLGSRVLSVRLRADGDGKTKLRPGPGAGVTAHSQIVPVLWIGVLLLVILLLSVRNLFGIAVVIGTGFLLFSIVHSKNAGLEVVTAYLLSWMLLLSGVRSVLEHGTGAGDAGILREMTGFPRSLWYLLWLIGSIAALVWGSTMLV